MVTIQAERAAERERRLQTLSVTASSLWPKAFEGLVLAVKDSEDEAVTIHSRNRKRKQDDTDDTKESNFSTGSTAQPNFVSALPALPTSNSAESSAPSPKASKAAPKVPKAWPLRRLPEHPVTVRAGGGTGSGRTERAVSDAELSSLAPAHVIRKALPSQLAEELLKQLLQESKSAWQSSSWVIHGKTQTTPRTSAMYNLTDSDTPLQRPGEEESRATCVPSALLKEAAEHIHAAVKKHRPESTWSPNLAFGNRYDDGRACVGWHSDFLNSLGPRPIIVGLALGACRRFCLRRVVDSMVVTIPMPHNTVVIMWDDCQEEWDHSVPRQADSTIPKHSLAGLVRISLTFRMARLSAPGFTNGDLHCKPCVLKSKRGHYYLACSPVGTSSQCGFWEHCAWAQAEAERLRRAGGNANTSMDWSAA
ncbi:unnamed protein product [Cladocopium goreaui]|uniref:Alpha-ketoglutarate-dependent dioxygenase alkB homolog 3 (Alkylated DNA repair protein alkB homolog 3) (HABH3) (DEPC-1) (Prostate cancer antigen 1) n=1 Tax=Cladocopium goreaui TaxID=2562237 RepID=A0A9P1D3P6_9DINO|nr:unnamed protein product [Cladocopium goreaui]